MPHNFIDMDKLKEIPGMNVLASTFLFIKTVAVFLFMAGFEIFLQKNMKSLVREHPLASSGGPEKVLPIRGGNKECLKMP